MLSFSNNIGRVLPIFFSSFFYGDCYEYLVFVGGAVCAVVCCASTGGARCCCGVLAFGGGVWGDVGAAGRT